MTLLPHPLVGGAFASPVAPGTGWPDDPGAPDTPVARDRDDAVELGAMIRRQQAEPVTQGPALGSGAVLCRAELDLDPGECDLAHAKTTWPSMPSTAPLLVRW